MITSISGELVRVESGSAELRVDGLVYEVLVPAFEEERLRAELGGELTLHTLHYLESQGQGSSFWPRLIGFRTPAERDFFELFTTVKGIGNRRALRALQIPCASVAEAISRRDVSFLTTLPEIGRKTAESIVVELKGRVDRFAGLVEMRAAATPKEATPPASRRKSAATVAAAVPAPAHAPALAPVATSGFAAFGDAVEVLVQLGENRISARQLIERAIDRNPDLRGAEAIVAAALQVR